MVSREKPAVPELSTGGQRFWGLDNVSSQWDPTKQGILDSCLSVCLCLAAKPPAPMLAFLGTYQTIEHPSSNAVLACKAPRNVFEFQLRQGEKMLTIHGARPLRELSLYYLNLTDMDDQSPLTCRYRLHRSLDTWSEDSEPKELMWSDGELHSCAADKRGLESQKW